ncbi:MAG TPA: hypothetical protein VHC47_09550 [Mucilaginibacter sp.]|nr:hypothetical protein [Mucilaginibacter sp.]
MKKLLLFSALLFLCTLHSRALANIHVIIKQTDTAKVNKKIKNLQSDLAGYQTELIKVQTQIPLDSVAAVKAGSEADDALADSKKAASKAVGGDLGDARKAEKKAKEAAKAKDDAHDAQKQLDKDREKVKKLTRKIEKAKKKLSELQSQQ